MALVNQSGDGATVPSQIRGYSCHELRRYPGRPELYIYFQLAPSLKVIPTNDVLVTVDYFDAAPGYFVMDYDSFSEAKSSGAYTRTRTRVDLKADQRWHRAAFVLERPRFEQRQNDGADFRLAVIGPRLAVRSISLAQE